MNTLEHNYLSMLTDGARAAFGSGSRPATAYGAAMWALLAEFSESRPVAALDDEEIVGRLGVSCLVHGSLWSRSTAGARNGLVLLSSAVNCCGR